MSAPKPHSGSDVEIVREALHRNGWRGDHTAYGGKNYALRDEGLAALGRLEEQLEAQRQTLVAIEYLSQNPLAAMGQVGYLARKALASSPASSRDSA